MSSTKTLTPATTQNSTSSAACVRPGDWIAYDDRCDTYAREGLVVRVDEASSTVFVSDGMILADGTGRVTGTVYAGRCRLIAPPEDAWLEGLVGAVFAAILLGMHRMHPKAGDAPRGASVFYLWSADLAGQREASARGLRVLATTGSAWRPAEGDVPREALRGLLALGLAQLDVVRSMLQDHDGIHALAKQLRHTVMNELGTDLPPVERAANGEWYTPDGALAFDADEYKASVETIAAAWRDAPSLGARPDAHDA